MFSGKYRMLTEIKHNLWEQANYVYQTYELLSHPDTLSANGQLTYTSVGSWEKFKSCAGFSRRRLEDIEPVKNFFPRHLNVLQMDDATKEEYLEEKESGKELYLHIYGHLDNLKYKFDREKIKTERVEKIKEEKENHLKNLEL